VPEHRGLERVRRGAVGQSQVDRFVQALGFRRLRMRAPPRCEGGAGAVGVDPADAAVFRLSELFERAIDGRSGGGFEEQPLALLAGRPRGGGRAGKLVAGSSIRASRYSG